MNHHTTFVLVLCVAFISVHVEAFLPASRPRALIRFNNERKLSTLRMAVEETSPPDADNRTASPKNIVDDETIVAGNDRIWSPRSRQVIGAVGSVGALECAYITYSKLFQPDVLTNGLCSTGGCTDVLTGPFSQLGPIPLTAPAFLIYGAVAALALWPLTLQDPEKRATAEETTRPYILISGTVLATFSAYLVSLLIFQLQAFCPYCVLSAACSFTIAAVAWAGRAVADQAKAAVLGACSFLITGLGSGLLYYYTASGVLGAPPPALAAETMVVREAAAPAPLMAPPAVTAASTPEALALAADLKALDARMFGAYWCSHCYNQKQAFGKEAFGKLEYVECSKKGLDNQAALCQKRDLPGYPTWEIDGELYPGERDLASLRELVDDIKQSKK